MQQTQLRISFAAIFTASIDRHAPVIDSKGREVFEVQDHLNYRWWAPDELGASSALFYPQSLPLHIAVLATGQAVDEPLEIWEELT